MAPQRRGLTPLVCVPSMWLWAPVRFSITTIIIITETTETTTTQTKGGKKWNTQKNNFNEMTRRGKLGREWRLTVTVTPCSLVFCRLVVSSPSKHIAKPINNPCARNKKKKKKTTNTDQVWHTSPTTSLCCPKTPRQMCFRWLQLCQLRRNVQKRYKPHDTLLCQCPTEESNNCWQQWEGGWKKKQRGERKNLPLFYGVIFWCCEHYRECCCLCHN